MNNNNEISSRIKMVREDAGENLSEFSRSIGVPRSTLVGYEDKSTIPANVLHAIAVKYNISEEWLLSGNGTMKKQNQEVDKSALCCEATSRQKVDKSAPNDIKDTISDSIEDLALASTAPKFAELEEKMDGKFSAQEEKLNGLQKRLEDLESAFSSGVKPKEAPLPRAEEVKEAAPPYGADCEADEEETVELPLAENLAAGMPREAFSTGETFSVPAKFLKKRKKYCVAKIKGTSMTDAGIADGAFVLLEMNETPVDDMIVLARYDDQTTLKRLREKEGGGWELCYEDGSMATIDLSGHDWTVVGRFVRVVG